jgi:hypothetical protein
LRLPVAGTVGKLYPSVAACLVGLAISVAAKLASNWSGANVVQEDSMDKMVHQKMVRGSVLSTIGDIGTAAVGGLLAACGHV